MFYYLSVLARRIWEKTGVHFTELAVVAVPCYIFVGALLWQVGRVRGQMHVDASFGRAKRHHYQGVFPMVIFHHNIRPILMSYMSRSVGKGYVMHICAPVLGCGPHEVQVLDLFIRHIVEY